MTANTTNYTELVASQEAERERNAQLVGAYATDDEIMKSINLVGFVTYTVVLIVASIAIIWYMDHVPVPPIPMQ